MLSFISGCKFQLSFHAFFKEEIFHAWADLENANSCSEEMEMPTELTTYCLIRHLRFSSTRQFWCLKILSEINQAFYFLDVWWKIPDYLGVAVCLICKLHFLTLLNLQRFCERALKVICVLPFIDW